jgi:hypothetical protein
MLRLVKGEVSEPVSVLPCFDMYVENWEREQRLSVRIVKTGSDKMLSAYGSKREGERIF